MSETALITAHDLVRHYRANDAALPAVRDVSLEVLQGEFVALMGPSGCGKSTLLNMLGGIDRPDSGEVWVADQRVDTRSETQLALFRRRHVGIVFQFFHLIQNLDARANIELPALLAAAPAADVHARSQELMAALGVAALARKLPAHLSGGEQQRVAIARALINRPALLLADEPTGALDQQSGQAVLRLFQEVHRQGQTIVMVTHDPKVAGYAQRILTMQDGQIVAESRSDRQDPARLAERLIGKRV